jgi:hypothetical protein
MLTGSLYSATGVASTSGNPPVLSADSTNPPSRTSGSGGPLDRRGRLAARRSAQRCNCGMIPLHEHPLLP